MSPTPWHKKLQIYRQIARENAISHEIQQVVVRSDLETLIGTFIALFCRDIPSTIGNQYCFQAFKFTADFRKMDLKKIFLVLRLGIRQKVILVLITVLLTALSLSGWMALQEEKEQVLREIDRRGSDISRFVSKSMAFSVVGYDYHTIQLLLDEIVLSKDISYARVISRKGNTMAEAGEAHRLLKEDQRLVLFEQDILIEGDKVGRLVLGLDTSATIARLESQKYSLVKREAVVILLIAVAEFLALSFLIIRPVSIMSRSLDNSIDDSGKIVGEIPIDSNDEFGHLANQFNSLRNQLNDSNEALRSRIEFADKQLLENYKHLTSQSEELKKMNDEFRRLSVTDPLTGLYNRRHFEELMKKETAIADQHGEIYSILLIDIDHFKDVNDAFGHLEGDTVLKEVARILSCYLRQSDILCRIGGEEFIVLIKCMGRMDALAISEKIRTAIEDQVFKFAEETIRITVSIGVSTYSIDSASDINEPIKRADEALYYCKENGRNQTAHYDTLPVAFTKEAHKVAKVASIHKFTLKGNGGS